MISYKPNQEKVSMNIIFNISVYSPLYVLIS
nr:MAG TPA: hypothetical protein [Caudoviricetes sp.]